MASLGLGDVVRPEQVVYQPHKGHIDFNQQHAPPPPVRFFTGFARCFCADSQFSQEARKSGRKSIDGDYRNREYVCVCVARIDVRVVHSDQTAIGRCETLIGAQFGRPAGGRRRRTGSCFCFCFAPIRCSPVACEQAEVVAQTAAVSVSAASATTAAVSYAQMLKVAM